MTDQQQQDPFDPDRSYDAALRLLDRQLLDPDGAFLGKVDGLEITYTPGQPPTVTAILLGPGAWGPRMPGRLGRYTTAIWKRLRPDTNPQPRRIGLFEITAIDSAVHLRHTKDHYPTATIEAWVDHHLMGKLPGASHATE